MKNKLFLQTLFVLSICVNIQASSATVEPTIDDTHSKHLLTHGDYVERSLYGPLGHYVYNKRIDSFKTHAMEKALPISIASILHDDFINKEHPSEYKVAELSGGNGQLTFNVLSIIKHLAEENILEFASLYESIHYSVYEISPALANLQRKNKRFIDENKLDIIDKSATCLNKHFHFVFMNELWDALPFEQIKISASGKIEMKVLLPMIKKDTLRESAITINNTESLNLERYLKDKHKRTYEEYQVISNADYGSLLERSCQDKLLNRFIRNIEFREIWVDIDSLANGIHHRN